MSIDHPETPRPLPDRPNLRHLKGQAKDLLKAGAAASITDAQFKIARLYGFASWPKLKAHIDSLEEIGQLKQAIDTNDIVRVKTMMTRNPTLHSAPLGYGKDGPLTWVAECRVPWEPPSPARLAMATWMLEHASYARSPQLLSTCMDILLEAGGATKYDAPAVVQLLRGRLDSLAEQLDADPALVNRPFSELDCGMTGGRELTLQGGTLLHVAAE